jgi:hypothetical protein
MATEAHGKNGIFTDNFCVFRMDSVAIYHDFDSSKYHSAMMGQFSMEQPADFAGRQIFIRLSGRV